MWHSRPPRTPPPFMANTILNFHFDYWNPSLRWYSPGRRWRVSSSTTFPRCSKPRTPVCSLWSRWVSSSRVSRFLALLDTQREKCRPNFNNNFYHRTRRRGTNCPPDHRMENTLAKGPVSQGQMWSDCFVFKSAAQNVIWWICWNYHDEKRKIKHAHRLLCLRAICFLNTKDVNQMQN